MSKVPLQGPLIHLVHPDETQVCTLSEEALSWLPKRQREKVKQLGALVIDHCYQLQEIHQIQVQYTDEDPLQGQGTDTIGGTAKPSLNAVNSQAGSSGTSDMPIDLDPDSIPSTTPMGRATRLTDEQEAHLLAFFSLQDTLTREATAHLVKEVGCSDRQVKEYFSRLRKTVRDFMHRLQKKTWDVPTGSHSLPAAPGIPSAAAPASQDQAIKPHLQTHNLVIDLEDARFTENAAQDMFQEQQAKLDRSRQDAFGILEANTRGGHIQSVDSAEAIANLMRHTRSWSIRQTCLMAIKATKNHTILQKVLHSVHLLAMLSSWIDEAVQNGQFSCLRAILKALRQFRLHEKDLKYNDLPKQVTALQSHSAAQVSKLSKKLLLQWGLLSSPKKQTNLNATALDPVASAVPLKKRAVETQKQPANQPTQSRKRPLGPSAGFDHARASGQNKAQAVAGKLNPAGKPNTARLDVTALGNIKANRQPAPKTRANPQQEEAMLHYKQQLNYLQAQMESYRVQEEQIARAQGASTTWFARQESVPFYAPEAQLLLHFDLKAGEESQERLILDSKHRSRAGSSHRQGPPPLSSPSEPLYEPPVPIKTIQIPFLPIDPAEVVQQYQKLKDGGLLLEHLIPPSFFPAAQVKPQVQQQQRNSYPMYGYANAADPQSR